MRTISPDVQTDPDALPFFQTYTHDEFCVGIEAVSALTCYEVGDDYGSFTYPGFDGLDLGDEGKKEEPYIFHFPDGNASVARLLVRSLIPAAIPGHTMDDIVTARADYAQLDDAKSAIRIRLNSSVVQVGNDGPAKSAKGVTVAYMRGGKLQTVRAKSCVLACYNMMIPFLCPELAGKTEGSPAPVGEITSGLHPRGDPELEYVSSAWNSADYRARKLPHLHRAGFSRKPGRISVSQQTGGANGAVHAAHALQSGTAAIAIRTA